MNRIGKTAKPIAANIVNTMSLVPAVEISFHNKSVPKSNITPTIARIPYFNNNDKYEQNFNAFLCSEL